MLKEIAIGLLAAVAAVGNATAEEKVQLSRGGKAEAVIVVAKDADKAARFAAADLKWHLDSITGGDFKIVADDSAADAPLLICVGPSSISSVKREDFKPQEFSVKAYPGRVELVGRDKEDKSDFVLKMEPEGVLLKNAPDFFDEQGTMYAVYDFLERECGVVWADTSDLGTVLPHKPDFTVSVTDRKKKPFIEYRGGTITGHRLKSDLWKKDTPGSDAFRAVAYHHPRRYDAQDRLFRLRHRIGGVNRNANHSFYHYYDKYWNEDSKSFVRKWPEIFAKGYVGLPPQMCYSSQEFIDLVIKDVREYFDQDPKTGKFKWGRDNYCLEPMDNSFYCKCPDCQRQMEPDREGDKASDSTYWFRFVKTVADEIAKTHPTKRMSTLAYHSHEGLPNGFRLPKNVIVYFCISSNRRPYSIVLDQQLARMKEWRDAYPNQPLAMWLYNTFPLENTDKGGFNCLPGFFADEAYKQFQFFKENDIRAGIFHCGFNGEIDNYMHLEWMIDPDRRPEEMLDEYFRGYGRAAVPLKEYYRTVEARYCDKSRYPKGAARQTAALAWGGEGTAEFMEKLGRLMGEAEAAAETPDEKRRVEMWRREYWDYMREGYETFVERQRSPKPDWIARRVADASGDVQKVDWSAAEEHKFRLFDAGTTDETKIEGSARIVHDGKWLYLELDLAIDVTNNETSAGIFPWDTWELFFACQEALPYRHYASSPDGRIMGASNGEVNWRMNVSATESGPPAYGAKVVSDRSDPHLWRQRFAFPLDTMLDKPVKPGETIYLNCISVLNPKITKGKSSNFILSVTPATTVHVTDRMGKVTLEKLSNLAEFPGQVGEGSGWKCVGSEEGKVVYIPFEGYYESKGGRIESPRFKLDGEIGKNRFYRLTFSAKCPVDGYWWVDFFDAEGNPLPDVNSRLYASDDWTPYDVMVPARPDAAFAQIAFVTKKGAQAKDVSMRQASVAEAAKWCNDLAATLPKLDAPDTKGAWDGLQKARAKILSGVPVTIVLLGDSIMNDTWCGNAVALIQDALPKANLRCYLSVRGSTGCWYYHEKGHFEEYVAKYKPDLVVIGGISNYGGPAYHSLKEVEDCMVETILRCQLIGAEVVVCTPPPSYEFRKDAAAKPFDRSLLQEKDGFLYLQQEYERRAAQRAGAQVWDLTTAPCEAIARSGKPLDWFKRDAAHNDDRGKHLIAQALAAYFKAVNGQ